MKAILISTGKLSKRLKDRTLHIASENGEFVIGRIREAQCMILDVNVSRRHASVKFDSQIQKWTVMDNKSLNGVYINGKKIPPNLPFPLNHCDKFSLAEDGDYEWRFEVEKALEEASQVETNISHMNQLVNANIETAMKRFEEEKEALEAKVSEEKSVQEQLKKEKDQLAEELKLKRDEFEAKQKAEHEEFEKKLFATKELSEQNRKEMEQRLEKEKQDFETKQADLEAEMAVKIQQSETKIEQLQKDKELTVQTLETEKSKLEEKLESERLRYEEQIRDLEMSNKASEIMQQEIFQNLNSEFAEKMKQSQNEFESVIQLEKNEREEERQKLAEQLKVQEEEIAKLNAQLQGVEDEKAKQMKRDTQLNLLKKCNEELTCSICNELFVTPMSLNCGHVYCEFCINQWKEKCSKNTPFTCPNCRQLIMNQTKSLHLENLISSLYEDIDETIKEERKNLVEFREAEIEKAKQDKDQKGKGKKNKNTGNIRDWAGNPNAGGRQPQPGTAPRGINPAPPVVNLTERPS